MAVGMIINTSHDGRKEAVIYATDSTAGLNTWFVTALVELRKW